MEQKEMSFKEYLESKQKLFEGSEHPEGLTWDQIKQQIISAYYLNLSQEQINLFTDGKHTFKQMEIIKFALFAGIGEKSLSELKEPNKNIAEMLAVFFADAEAWYTDTLQILRDAVKVCQDEMTYLKEHVTMSRNQDREKITALQKENTELKKISMQQAEEIDELNRQISISADRASVDLKKQEQQKAYHAQIEALAKKKYEERILKLKIEKQKEEEMRDKIRNEMIASGEIVGKQKKKKHIFEHFWKKEMFHAPQTFEKQPLPKNFDLAEYILSADLTSSQLKIITVCVKAELDESIIKQLIDSHLPGEQMKSIVEIILTKEEKEQSKKQETRITNAEPLEDYYDDEFEDRIGGFDEYGQQ